MPLRAAAVLSLLALAPPVRAADPSPANAQRARPRRSIAVLAVAGAGLDPDAAKLVEELVVGSLDATGRFKVTSRNDMAAVLGFEKQKQVMGCEEASCIAEIAGALGVELVAAPRAGRLDDLTMLTLSIVDVKSAAALARSRRSLGKASELPGAVDAMVAEMLGVIDGAARSGGSEPVTEVPGSAAPARVSVDASPLPGPARPERGRASRFGAKTWLAAGAAVVAAGAAAWFASTALAEAKTRDSTLSRAEYARASAAAEDAVTRSNIAWGVAGTATVAAGVFVAFPF